MKTHFDELIELRNFLEFTKEDMRNQNVRQYSDPSDPEKMAMDIRNHQNNPHERLEHGFTREQLQAWSQYTTQRIHTLWQDLFNLAAEEQDVEPLKLPIQSSEDLKVFEPKKIGMDLVPVPGQWGTLPLSMKGAPNGTTSKNIYRRV